ncbi:MAG: adenylate/guanylate cyclase domain-containing protein [Candidatus Hermodarchaeota archaeon]
MIPIKDYLNARKRIIASYSKIDDRIGDSELRSFPILGKDRSKFNINKAIVLFCNIMGLNITLEDLDSLSTSFLVLKLFLTEATAAIRVGEGLLRDYTGDDVSAIFPAENLPENCDKAVTSAILLQTVIEKIINPLILSWGHNPLQCGIGIDIGHMFMANITPPREKRKFLIYMGHHVDFAKKISQQSKVGEVSISNRIYDILSPEMKNSSSGWAWKKHLVEDEAIWIIKETLEVE